MTRAPIHGRAVARRFGDAASRYERHADLQRDVAEALARRIARLPLPARPRILEIGCGTGFLSAALARRIGPAHWTLTDIAPAMLDTARRRLDLSGQCDWRVMDGEFPHDDLGQFDLVCSSLAMQWFGDLDAGLARLGALLAPGGWMAVATLADGTFAEWRAAHTAHGQAAAVRDYPRHDAIGGALPGLIRAMDSERRVQRHPSGMAFLRSLKAIGADAPAAGARPLSPGSLKRILATFDEQGASVTYNLAYGTWNKPGAARGVFVAGTDTGIGKTLVSAILARAWQADYWKPLQTGVAAEPGDTGTVAALAGLPPTRIHPPHAVLQAPLSPWDAAREEAAHLDAADIALPSTSAPLVVEGAGGLLVPVDGKTTMIDLIGRLGLPVVLVARSTLGTLNHTLLSLEALRARGIAVAGVILSGEPSAINRNGIQHFGKVRILAEIPRLPAVDTQTVAELAGAIPPLDDVIAEAKISLGTKG